MSKEQLISAAPQSDFNGTQTGQIKVFTLTELFADTCNIVFNVNDGGAGSLRQAIECAEISDTIKFNNSVFGDTIKLTSNSIDIMKNLTIEGDINNKIVLKADFKAENQNSIINIMPGINLTINKIDFIGDSTLLEGIINNEGILLLNNVSLNFLQNITNSPPHIINSGTLKFEDDNLIKN